MPTRKKATAKPSVLVILGPTATGKSDLAVTLAKKFNGEVISADSRQVYRGLNLGAGKITVNEMEGVPHHLLDIADPKQQFSVSEYQKLGEQAIAQILERGKLPIICGGTGLYIDALLGTTSIPNVPPNPQLRKCLAKMSVAALHIELKQIDPRRARSIEKENPVRLIRAIEIAKAIGAVPTLKKAKHPYRVLKIGLDWPDNELKKRIGLRAALRIKKGMLREATALHEKGLGWKRMRQLGLEYRYLAQYSQKEISKDELRARIERGNWQFVKRQRRWFKRDKETFWFTPREKTAILRLVRGFLALS